MNIPKHIAIIMDGNGRWARRRGLPRTAGHKIGVDKIDRISRDAKSLGVKIITFFAFSTENWSRPKDEIDFLFSYLDKFIDKYGEDFVAEKVKFNLIGRRDRVKKSIIERLEELERKTADNKNFIINIALDYGGRWDIVEATKKILAEARENRLPDEVTEEYFQERLALGKLPRPDLLIRTSGEYRISNFLLWDLAYSELYFPKTFWPAFSKRHLKKAIKIFSRRDRRFGKI